MVDVNSEWVSSDSIGKCTPNVLFFEKNNSCVFAMLLQKHMSYLNTGENTGENTGWNQKYWETMLGIYVFFVNCLMLLYIFSIIFVSNKNVCLLFAI